jgi:hypothetical protein
MFLRVATYPNTVKERYGISNTRLMANPGKSLATKLPKKSLSINKRR